MPEIPEVETVANGVHARIHGQTLSVYRPATNPKPSNPRPTRSLKPSRFRFAPVQRYDPSEDAQNNSGGNKQEGRRVIVLEVRFARMTGQPDLCGITELSSGWRLFGRNLSS